MENIVPLRPIQEHINSLDCKLGFKAILTGEHASKEDNVLKKNSLDIMRFYYLLSLVEAECHF